MKQLKEPKATEKQAKRTMRATSAEKLDMESSGKLHPILVSKNKLAGSVFYNRIKLFFLILSYLQHPYEIAEF